MSTLQDGICPKCRSAQILPNAGAANGHELCIQVYEKSGVMPKGRRSFPIRAWVCTECGYTEFYVTNPQDLARSYRRSLASVFG